jgi:integrator complex subunit 10
MQSGSGEKYLISKSKEAQNKDPCSAKAWILTAKTLYPNDFGVQVKYSHLLFTNKNNIQRVALAPKTKN